MSNDAALQLDHGTPRSLHLHFRSARRAIISHYQTNPLYVLFTNRISLSKSILCQPDTSEHQAKHSTFKLSPKPSKTSGTLRKTASLRHVRGTMRVTSP